MRRILQRGIQTYQILAWEEVLPEDAIEEFRDRFSALSFLRGLTHDQYNFAALREILIGVDSSCDTSRLHDDEVLEALSWRLISGQVIVVAKPFKIPIGGFDAEEEEEDDAPPAAVVPQETEWVKFKIVEDLTGIPVSGVTLKIKVPDGSWQDHTTDDEGLIEIDNINPGTCEAACDIKGAKKEDTYAFVAMGVWRTSKEDDDEQDQALQCSHIAVVREHRVKTGESLESIAAADDLTWQDLAEFNWETSNPEEINEYLRDEVGCTKKTTDGYNYILTSEDEPGILCVPKKWEKRGLPTGRTHTIRVRQIRDFLVILENAQKLRIPRARYVAVLADGSTETGRLGRSGIARIMNPPLGEVEVEFPDLDDVEAKSLAACARKACDDRNPEEFYRVLEHSSTLLKKVSQAYNTYFNDYTGQGFIEDIYQEITDPDALMAVEGLLARAGLPTHREVRYVLLSEAEIGV